MDNAGVDIAGVIGSRKSMCAQKSLSYTLSRLVLQLFLALMQPITMKRNAMFFGHVNSKNVNSGYFGYL